MTSIFVEDSIGQSIWSNLQVLFPSAQKPFPHSCEENGAVGNMELWGKYSLYSIKGSVGNEIWCWTMSGKIKKRRFSPVRIGEIAALVPYTSALQIYAWEISRNWCLFCFLFFGRKGLGTCTRVRESLPLVTALLAILVLLVCLVLPKLMYFWNTAKSCIFWNTFTKFDFSVKKIHDTTCKGSCVVYTFRKLNLPKNANNFYFLLKYYALSSVY